MKPAPELAPVQTRILPQSYRSLTVLRPSGIVAGFSRWLCAISPDLAEWGQMGLSSRRPYSPECVEGGFSELRL
jgi:hypothetical protein